MTLTAHSPSTQVGGQTFYTTLTRFTLPEGRKIKSIHRLVMAGFPDGQGENPRAKWHVLYRVDGSQCLVQADTVPNWDGLVDAESKAVTVSAVNGDRFVMRLAVHCVARQGSKESKITAEEWLSRRNIGASIEVESTDYSWVNDWSGPNAIPIYRAAINGVATVTDADLFLENLRSGIGRGKAYGCGLCSVVRLGN